MEGHYVEGLIAVVARQNALEDGLAGAASEELDGAEVIQVGDLAERLGVEAETLTPLAETSAFLEFHDPIEGSLRLRSTPFDGLPINASPIHVLQNQWHKASGTPHPESAGGQVPQDPGTREPDLEGVIATIDTGLTEESEMPMWMRDSVEADFVERFDGQNPGRSHGAFVASIMRRVAPDHKVHMATAASISADRVAEGAVNDGDGSFTTEAHVAAAIRALANQFEGRDTVSALNISMGGYLAADGIPMALLASAIDEWRLKLPCAPIFAAAGNSQSAEPFFPAADSYVRGVAALDEAEREIVWRRGNDGSTSEVAWASDENLNRANGPIPMRHWVDELAPGSQLLGYGGGTDKSGNKDDGFVCWSGSSFASAVAAAAHSRGEKRPLRVGSRVLWPYSTDGVEVCAYGTDGNAS